MTPRGDFWLQICNERLLPRFGVDRLLILAGRFFQRHDIEVSYLCLRYDPREFDQEQVTTIAVQPGLDIRGTERQVTNLVMASWMQRKPDILLIGGWPFFELAGRSASVGVPSIFIDAGAVPHNDLEDNALWPQLEVRRRRQAFLPYISRVLPISDFIRDTQTLPDRCHGSGVRTVLLGSDHLTAQLTVHAPPGRIAEAVRSLRQSGRFLLLNLGRFEDRGYKNSPRFLEIVGRARQAGLNIVGLVLATPDEVVVPPALRDHILCLGRVTDAELVAIMREVDIGLSMSLWEGFNLPIVEMQNIGKPVLAFNLGAHPEVIAHPWLLCRDEEDMLLRLKAVLDGHRDVARIVMPAVAEFANRLPWSDTLQQWLAELHGLHAQSRQPSDQPIGRRLLLVDVTNSALDTANSGVIRVTRQLTRRLKADPRFDVLFARWDAELHSYVTILEDDRLSGFGGPTDVLGVVSASIPARFVLDTLYFGRDPQASTLPIALIPEVALDGTIEERNRWLRYRGFLVSAVLHDLIPVYYPEYCAPDVIGAFPGYLQVLQGADQCISNSANTMADFVRHARTEGARLPSGRISIELGAQLGQLPRVVSYPAPAAEEVRILCVSTLEPRKNHRRLLQAFRLLVERRPDLRLRLVLVGNAYAGSPDLVASIDQARQDALPISWLGVVSDQELAEQYRRARFTVYPSLVEGFGIPIVESLWLGRPCICASTGVMAELAAGGGCLAVDMLNPIALAEALEQLSENDELHQLLVQEAVSRPLSTWDDYARRVGNALDGLANLRAATTEGTAPEPAAGNHQRSYIEELLDGAALLSQRFAG